MSASVLTPADIPTRGAWRRVPAIQTARYRALSGGTTAADPAGLAVVAARRAFTRSRPLPPGGVLLTIETTFFREFCPDEGLEFRCSVDERIDRGGRMIIGVNVELRAPGAGCAALVRFVMLWPDEGGSLDRT